MTAVVITRRKHKNDENDQQTSIKELGAGEFFERLSASEVRHVDVVLGTLLLG